MEGGGYQRYESGETALPRSYQPRGRTSSNDFPTGRRTASSGYQANVTSRSNSGHQAGSAPVSSNSYQAGGSTIASSGYQAGGSTIASSGYKAGGSTIASSGYQAGGSTIPSGGYQAGGSTIANNGYQAGGSTIASNGYQAGGQAVTSGGYQAGGQALTTNDRKYSYEGGEQLPSTTFARYDSQGDALPKFNFGENNQKFDFSNENQKDFNNSNGEAAPAPTEDPFSTPQNPLSPAKWALLFTSLCLAVLCQALDNTILATAIPRITDEFDSLADVGWYGSSYLLTTCAFQLSYGKLYNYFPIKWVFLIALGIFEGGSLLCGAAPNSFSLILGRSIAGVGSGGVFSGALLMIAQSLPLAQRPIYNGILGSMYAVASIAGPLMGGAFTDRVTWRLCFYINLPLGFVTAVCVFFFLDRKTGKNDRWNMPFFAKIMEIDLLGLALLVPSIVCVLLGLQWGGSTYSWRNFRVILLLTLFAVLLCAFIAVQILKGDKATVPPNAVKNRTVWACCIFAFFIFGSFLSITYYLPIWFQAIRGDTATESGINNLPSILGTVIFSIIAGGMVFGIGYYTWAMILGSCLAAIGAGLLSTFTVNTPSSQWIGYQVIYGAGIGIGLQQPLIAVQTALPDYQVAEGTAIIIFIQSFGGAVMIAAAQNVFNNKLLGNVAARGVPINPAALLSEGATQLAELVPEQFLLPLREAYNESITQTFYVTVATAALSLIGSSLIPWLSVKKEKAPPKPDQENNIQMSDRGDASSSNRDANSFIEIKPSEKEMQPISNKVDEPLETNTRRFSSFSKKLPNAPSSDPADVQYQKELGHYKRDFDLHGQNANLYDKKVRLYDKNVELYERNVRLYDANSRLYDKSVTRYEDMEKNRGFSNSTRF